MVGKMAEIYASYLGKRDAYTILVEDLEGKMALGRPRSRWEDNIKIDLKDICCEYMEHIYLNECRISSVAVVSTITNLCVQ
jgi:hypothetical protein